VVGYCGKRSKAQSMKYKVIQYTVAYHISYVMRQHHNDNNVPEQDCKEKLAREKKKNYSTRKISLTSAKAMYLDKAINTMRYIKDDLI
jgi:hypothetical protein